MFRAILAAASFLVIPLAALLCAQWPLRDWIQAGSRTANDAAQVVFALYVAVAIAAASRAGTHLAAHPGVPPSEAPEVPSQPPDDPYEAPHVPDSSDGAPPGAGNRARWRDWAVLACVGPWAAFMLWASWPVIRDSLAVAENFADTLTPGYFLIKVALGLLLLLVLLDAVVRTLGTRSGGSRT